MSNIYIHDDIFTEDELVAIEQKCLDQGSEFTPTDNCNEFIQETPHFNESDFINLIRDKGVLPPEKKYVASIFRIRQLCGGQIRPHTDGHYYFVMSLYLNECEGGNLNVIDKDTNELFSIEPKRNRLVILTADNMHWTTPLLSKERKSIQMFVKKVL